MRNASRALVTALMIGGLAACAGIVGGSPEQVVKERAQARWDALVKGDVKAAYGFLSPGTRAVTTEEVYASGVGKGFWKAVRVEKVTCGSEDNCEASGTIEYEYRGRRTSTPFRETWIKSGSDWWYVPK